MRTARSGWAAIVAAAVALPGLMSGCTGIEPALIGAAITGAGAGIGATRLGKINVAFHADGAQVVAAATHTADELGLTLVELDHRGHDRWIVELRDARKNTIIVAIDQRGRFVTHTQVNVGWFGSGAVGQLVAKRIGFHLFGEEDADRTGGG